jgi:uncharacterized protein (DUF885 family)
MQGAVGSRELRGAEKRAGRREIRRWALACGLLVTGACGGRATPPRSAPLDDSASRVLAVAREYSAAYSQAFPDVVEYVGQPLAHHDTLPDNSLAALEAWHAHVDAWLAALAKVDGNGLWGKPEWVLHGMLRNALENEVANRVCRAELWPAHQFGWQTTLLAIVDKQPLGTALARTEALSRWQQLPRFLETEVTNLREGIRLGYTAPRRNVELALGQLDALLGAPLNDSPLMGPARRDTDAEFRASWQQLVEAQLVPAVTRYRDFLRDEYAPRARTSIGIASIPNGAECYRARIKLNTTEQVAPRAMFELGTQLVAEREAKALQLARALFGDGISDLRAAKAAVDADPRNRFATAEEALSFVDQAMGRARQAAPRRIEVEHTTFHEGIPGHHLQIGRDQDADAPSSSGSSGSPDLPTVLDFGGMSAYYEGWARYAESLADEMGLYSSDLDRFGAVSHLPTGLVVDPGIHAMGWTRDAAMAWVSSKQVGFSPELIEAYVDRIAVCPGEMLSYGFGEHELLLLRHEAEATLGSKFDIKTFHERVLAQAVPLPMLREVVTRWIRQTANERR